ncbi:hypothetical protein F6P58_10925, partial [Streptococcus suis]|uniref:hypothetical protein n=1 Tax=Streptococcus suis TaxID=1307 RepID=UPI001EE790DC
SLFIIGHMGLFFYTQKGSIISTVVLPTTEIIEPLFSCSLSRIGALFVKKRGLYGSNKMYSIREGICGM